MPRLPTLGRNANWGALLNEFLLVSHRKDGTLKNSYTRFNVRNFGPRAMDIPIIESRFRPRSILPASDGTVYILTGTYNLSIADDILLSASDQPCIPCCFRIDSFA